MVKKYHHAKTAHAEHELYEVKRFSSADVTLNTILVRLNCSLFHDIL
jgi:hypothetical protein